MKVILVLAALIAVACAYSEEVSRMDLRFSKCIDSYNAGVPRCILSMDAEVSESVCCRGIPEPLHYLQEQHGLRQGLEC